MAVSLATILTQLMDYGAIVPKIVSSLSTRTTRPTSNASTDNAALTSSGIKRLVPAPVISQPHASLATFGINMLAVV